MSIWYLNGFCRFKNVVPSAIYVITELSMLSKIANGLRHMQEDSTYD